MTTYTLFLYHVNPYESQNFTATEAKICKRMQEFFDFITLDLWRIEPAKAIQDILNGDKAIVKMLKDEKKKQEQNYHNDVGSEGSTSCCRPKICFADEKTERCDHEEAKLGFQFLADMINRLCFLLIVICEIVAFSVTILTTVGSQSDVVRLNVIKQLEASSTSDPYNGLQMTNDFQLYVPYGK